MQFLSDCVVFLIAQFPPPPPPFILHHTSDLLLLVISASAWLASIRQGGLSLITCFSMHPSVVMKALYSLPPSSGWLQHIFVKVQPHQPLPLLRTRQSKIHYFINAVVYGPVKLLRLVTGQHQHKPTGKKSHLETCWEVAKLEQIKQNTV